MRIKVRSSIAFIALGSLAAPLLAQGANMVQARLNGYRELGAAFKNVNDELKSSSPQTMILQLSARQIRDVARQQYGWFPHGSGPRPGVKTAAKPEIWARAAQFKAAQDAFAAQANGFVSAVASKDVARMRTQARTLGQACAACHRTFRVEEKR